MITLNPLDEAAVDWRAAAARVKWDVRPFIDGRYQDSLAKDRFDKIDPATETRLCSVAVGAPADIDNAVEAARRRFADGAWSRLPPTRRAEVLFALASLIAEHRRELALLECLEIGKPITEAVNEVGEISTLYLRSWAAAAERLLGESLPLTPATLAFNTYEPRGVVGAITPWNFPVINAIFKIAPALAAGNTIVLKPSELCPASALKLAELALEAGVPDGVLNVVPGLGSTVGEALAGHPDIDFLAFTGSTATGRRIMALAGQSNGKPLLLECGGKSPQVVFSDVDNLDVVADAAVQSVLWNQGQVCSAHTRLVVQESIADELLSRVVERARRHVPQDPLEVTTDFGPLASPRQRDRVKHYVEEGVRAGAAAVLRGQIQEAGGCYVAPTVFDRVDRTMAIAREEIFGPVLCVQRFTSVEESVELANGTDFGLTATIWTRDIGRAKLMAREIRAGSIHLRTSGLEDPSSAPILSHEPQKASGFGPEIGVRGLQSYSTLKAVHLSGV